MSTRCTIHFHWGNEKEPDAIIYRHCDGYPDGENGVLADLFKFFSDVEEQTKDTRFGDPSYLAAKFVVWQAHQNATRLNWDTGEYEPAPMLDFISLGVVQRDPADIAYRYHVQCGGMGECKPVVEWEKV
jgi:hypothetical protein